MTGLKNCQHLDAREKCSLVGKIFSITVETISPAYQNVYANTERKRQTIHKSLQNYKSSHIAGLGKP